MIDFDYAGRHVRGVWRMISGDAGWAEDIDRSVDGVFRSFWAILFTTPFALLSFHAAHRAALASPQYEETVFSRAPAPVVIAGEMLAFGASWLASVVILALAARQFQATRNAAALIVAFNWSQLLTFAAASIPAAVLALTGSSPVFVALALPAIVFSIVVLWGVLRRNLPVTVGVAIALIALLTFAEIAINAITTEGAIALFQLLS